MTLIEYTQEVADYLAKKLPDANPATLCEIAEFFAMKTNNYAQDALNKNNEQWLVIMKKQDDWYLKIMKVK
jgi:hypothetical protein